MRNVYWLAIDKNDKHATYDELKDRKVVAQGWNSLGDLNHLLELIPTKKNEFLEKIQDNGDKIYHSLPWWNDTDRKITNAPSILWTLLNLKKGDLIVGLEGTTVKGICEIKKDAIESYKYDTTSLSLTNDHVEYSQTVGGSVTWVDWCKYRLGEPPAPSRRGFKGIKNLVSDREKVIEAWQSIDENERWWPETNILDTLKLDAIPRDGKIYFKSINKEPRFRYILNTDYLEQNFKLKSHKVDSDIIEFKSIESVVRAGWVLD